MAKAVTKSNIVVAEESFVCEHGGELLDVRGGDLFEADHPVVKRFPFRFKEPKLRFPNKADSRVEQATAAPGEKR